MAARTSQEIDERYWDEFDPQTEIEVDIAGQRVSGSWPCLKPWGYAGGAVFEEADLRGADLTSLEGNVRFERCQLTKASLPENAELIDCEEDDLFAIPGRMATMK